MKRITTIVLFVSIFAVAVGALGFSGTSATSLMVSTVPQSQETVGILGHVEYKVLDDVGNIKAYMQNDNIVVEAGKDCASQGLFTNTAGQVGQCIAGSAAFTYIGIGNGTLSGATTHLGAANQTLADASDDAVGSCGHTDAGVGVATGGDMARRNVTASFDVTGTSTIVTLETSGAGEPFTFNLSNETAVIDSGIFNADYETPTSVHTCGGVAETGGDNAVEWNLFSRQLLNGVTGISVSDGDSLSVKWTITVG